MYKNEGFLLFPIVYPKIGMNVAKGTLIQIWKIPLCLCSYKNNTLKISHS